MMMGDGEGTTATARGARGTTAAGKIAPHETGVTTTGSAGDPYGARHLHDARARVRTRRPVRPAGGGQGEAELCAVGPAGGRDEHGEECGRDEHAAQVQRAARGAQAPRWRLYVFKGEEQLELLHIHRQSAYLIGRDRTVADIPLEHPSCSKQHSVIQYRLVQQKDELGVSKAVIKPFVIDLESTNGTHVNGEAIPTSRYYELKAGDVLKFGTSNREYVLLHDGVA